MNRGIRIRKVWSDDDVIELEIDVSDGASSFSNHAYVGHAQLATAVAQLDAFREAVYGGIIDLRFGEFGPEYASGAFHGRFYFPQPGRLFITSRQESDFVEFGMKTVASRATLYLQSQPAPLDRFVNELNGLSTSLRDDAR